ncbi:hypothetical protein AX16_004600 [Volvariella volvacea WC 439]|nr:hypothetical protein AX16_004600 [Volvariella volvacea WC 439]
MPSATKPDATKKTPKSNKAATNDAGKAKAGSASKPKSLKASVTATGKEKKDVVKGKDKEVDSLVEKKVVKDKAATKENDTPKAKTKENAKAKEKEDKMVVDGEEIDKDDDDDDEDYITEEENEEDNSDEESEDEDSDNGGVDVKGWERLVKLMKEDGLDELGEEQLQALQGDSDDSDEENSEVERDGVSGSEDQEDSESEEVDLEDEEDEESEDDEEQENQVKNVKKKQDQNEEGSDDEEGDEDEEQEIPLDEAEDVDADALPRRKVVTDNKMALERIRETIQLDPSLPWTEILAMTYPHKIEVDVNDDLNRELAFYKQALHSANQARLLASQHNLPFTRPSDFFAEMVKSDAHMERIRQRLLDESASLKRSEEKRKEREGKKYGKQVQIEKIKERERSKKEFEERVKGLKRKRKDVLNSQGGADDDFDVAVEDAISDRPSKRSKTSSGASSSKPKLPRKVRDKKYGFGGAGRRSKQNTKSSTDDFDASKRVGGKLNTMGKKSGRGGAKGGAKRPGKSRRISARSKK